MARCRYCKKKVKENGITFKLSIVHEDCWDKFISNQVFNVKKKKKKSLKKVKDSLDRKKNLTYTQEVFNRYIRVRDTRPDDKGNCICCGTILVYPSKNTQAGHYKTRGARSDLRFNPDNVFLQCNHCNVYGTSETVAQFKEAIIERIGQKRFDALKKRTKQDYSAQALKAIRTEYNKKIKELIS